MTPVQLGAALGIVEDHKGARPSAASASMHTFGLATDINYTGNPWIAGQHVDRRADGSVTPAGQVTLQANANFTEAANRAALFVSGTRVNFTATFLNSLHQRPTGDIFDQLAQLNDDFRAYLALHNDTTGIEAKLRRHQQSGTPNVFESNETLSAAIARWQGLINGDLQRLRLDSTPALSGRGKTENVSQSNFAGRDPSAGFLRLHRDLVIALREVAGLAWGAVDFGTRESGDMMHFDARRSGVGATLNQP